MSRKAKKKPFKWTPLRRAFLKAYGKLHDQGKAAEAAGCKCKTEAGFRSRGSQLLKEIQENADHEEIMREMGIDWITVGAVVREALFANQTNLFHNPKTGEIREYLTPDWTARLKAAGTCAKLLGGYPKQQMELPFAVHDGRVVITAQFATNTGSFQDEDEERLAA